FGSLELGLGEVVGALLGSDDVAGRVVRDLRLPRALTAVCAGAALGVAGAVFQSISRNALGSPDVIGFTTGAATGGIAQIVVFGGGPLQVAAGAVGGGVVTAAVVYLLASKRGTTTGYRLVLVGIGVGSVMAAINNLLLVTGDLDSSATANLWLAGSLDARLWGHAVPVTVGVVLLVPLVAVVARRAALMEMGDDLSQQLGVRVERTRLLLTALGVLLAALAAGAVGPISFVALAAPQLVRRLTRGTGLPVVSAGFMGALVVVAGDLAARELPIDATIPIGQMTGILGGLYLIWLLGRRRTR
ncbi:MAG TPA: iron chelate uptake ABC transporter family permease subunit, partial [Nocardioides sp.]